MEEFTSDCFTSARVAEVGAFRDMTLGAVSPLLAKTTEPEGPADRGAWSGFGVSVGAVKFGAVTFGIMQAIGDTLGGHVMRQVARVATSTLAVFQHVFAQSYFVRVVNVAAGGAFRAGS